MSVDDDLLMMFIGKIGWLVVRAEASDDKDNPHWRLDAKCLDQDLDVNLFYMDYMSPRQWDELKSLCFSCPVQYDCLETAFARGEYGVWGGLRSRDRRLVLGARRQYKLQGRQGQFNPEG